jgi:hypothetical protein
MPLNGAGNLAPIKDAISRLHRLSVAIRKPALITQNSRAAKHTELNEEGQDVFDIFEKHVASRLVAVNCPDATVIIQRRLSQAMAFRRRRFHYRQRHQTKLSGRKAVIPRRQHLSPGNVTGYSTPRTARSTEFSLSKLADRSAKITSLGRAESVLSATTASRFEESNFKPDVLSTKASSILSGVGSQNHKLDILPPPKIPEGAVEFSCPHCCLVLPVSEAKPRPWR